MENVQLIQLSVCLAFGSSLVVFGLILNQFEKSYIGQTPSSDHVLPRTSLFIWRPAGHICPKTNFSVAQHTYKISKLHIVYGSSLRIRHLTSFTSLLIVAHAQNRSGRMFIDVATPPIFVFSCEFQRYSVAFQNIWPLTVTNRELLY